MFFKVSQKEKGQVSWGRLLFSKPLNINSLKFEGNKKITNCFHLVNPRFNEGNTK